MRSTDGTSAELMNQSGDDVTAFGSDQVAPAIDAYRKAAPLAPDGDTYLNLARLLWQDDRIPEAKEAAKQAMAKGLKKPDDAKKILALPAK